MHETDYSPDPGLTPVQHRVINFLAQGRTVTEAAAALGLHRNTIGNWNRCVPAFARELAHANRERSFYWYEQAAQLAPKAIEIICTILHNEQAPPSLRFRAALAIVKMAADPNPKPLKPFSTFGVEMDACNGHVRASARMHNPAQTPSHPESESPHAPESVPPLKQELQQGEHAQPAENLVAKFARQCDPEPDPASQPVRVARQPGRNSPCPCGSGQKFKRCCSGKPIPAHLPGQTAAKAA